MPMTAQEIYSTYSGTPYASRLNDFINYTPETYNGEEGGYTSPAAWEWNPGGEAGFQSYLKFIEQQNKVPNTKLIDITVPSTASDRMAAVTQAQYDNWKSTYFPALQAAQNMTTYKNPELIDSEVKKSVATAGMANFNAVGQQKRAIERFGMQATAEQQTAMDQAASSSKALSEVDASNRTRMNLTDRNKTIMAGNVGNFQGQY
ncbi:MAG: hypothetical protein ACOYL3_07020 [Desulfuromonadaceae bacterium]